MVVKKGETIVEIGTGKMLRVDEEVREAGISTQFDFLATYVVARRNVVAGNRGFKFSEEGKVWERL